MKTPADRIANATRSPLVVVVIAPKRYWLTLPAVPVRRARQQHHPGGDAAVEEDGERDVGAGAAARADQLDGDRADDRDDERGEDRRGLGEHPDRHAGQRDVAEAVADECQPTLHEVHADRRGGRADEDRRDEGPHHEVVLEDLHRAQPVPNHAVAAGTVWWW